MQELIAYAKANPGKLNYASAGKASPGHLTAEFFRPQTAEQLTHVPYKGNAEAIRSVLAGDTHIMFTPDDRRAAAHQGGQAEGARGVSRPTASMSCPACRPSKASTRRTLPFWYGMLAPAGTPREVVQRLNAETVKALKDPQVDKALRAARIFPIGNTPEEFAAMMREGHAAWGRVIRETGVKGE